MNKNLSIFFSWVDTTTHLPAFRRLPVIFGVLLLALLFGKFVSLSLVIFLLLFVVGVAVFLLLHRQPAWGILAMIPIAFLGYYPIPTGTNVALYASFLAIPALTIVWFLPRMLIKKDIQFIKSDVNLPAVIFIMVLTVSFVVGNFAWFPQAMERASIFAQIGAYGLYAFSILLMLLVGNSLPNIRWLKRMTWLFIIFGGLFILAQIIPTAGPYILRLFLPPIYSGTQIGSMVWTFFAAMAFAQVLFNRNLRRIWLVLLIILLAIEFYLGFIKDRDWVSGWLLLNLRDYHTLVTLMALGVSCHPRWRARYLLFFPRSVFLCTCEHPGL